MRRRRGRLIAAMVLACAQLAAQQNSPHAGYVYPAGGRQGASFEVTVGGQSLNGVSGALIGGDGVRLSVLEYIKPMQPVQAGMLRDRLKELNEKRRAANTPPATNKTVAADKSTVAAASTNTGIPAAPNTSGTTDKSPPANVTPVPDKSAVGGSSLAANASATADIPPAVWTSGDEEELRELRLKLAQFQKRSTNVAIAERVRLQVSIDAGAAAGKRELRLLTPNGVTNPVYFYVGRLPEWSKAPAGTVSEEEVNEQGYLRKRVENPAPTPVVEVTPPSIVNGQMAAGGVDRYRFMARKGEHLVVAASARELIPYIADAVPGWFQASLTLHDASGKEVQYADHYAFHPDPVLLYEIPADGEYTVAIHDSIYRGREDFVYRILLGEVPFITAMFPLGGKAGAKTNVEFSGWNLPQAQLKERSRGKDKGLVMLSLGEEEFNARPFALDTLPETLAKEEIHAREKAQKLSLPVIVNGRVERKDECEFFQMKGKAGEAIEAEVHARRLDSPLDSLLTLMDSKGKTLAENDDFPDESAGLLTDQADSLLRAKLPSNGSYYLRLCDTQRNGGPEFAYRLRVSHPEPDIDLRVVPSSVNAKAGSIVPVTIHAQRRGGFAGDIQVNLKDAPPGFQLNGGVIPAGKSKERVTLRVPENGNKQLFHLALEGAATVGDKQLRRDCLAADEWTQAFSYHHLIATNDLLIAVNGRQLPQVDWSWRADKPLSLPAGRSVAVKFALPQKLANRVQISLSNPPDGVAIEKIAPYEGGIVAYVKADGVKASAGLRGNLIVMATIERPPAQNKGKNNPQTELLPAFPFEVVTGTSALAAGGESAARPATR
ncbi:MAG: hypothetical protein ABR898_11505 [Terracidiphilus sp.]